MAVAIQELLHLMVPGMEGAAKTPFHFPADLPASSKDFYQRIESYAQRIRNTGSLDEIVAILDEALGDTRALQANAAVKIAEEKVRKAEAEIEALKSELQHTVSLTNLDPLTGTVNRRGLAAAFDREAARSDRHSHALCAVLLDIDNFKAINDTHGHAAGDDALVHLANVMRASLRPNDVMARVGGEEFFILLPDTNEREAFQALTRLRNAMAAEPVEHDGLRFTITFTASVGLRAYGESQAALSERLDQALYRAKHAGKNRVLFAVP